MKPYHCLVASLIFAGHCLIASAIAADEPKKVVTLELGASAPDFSLPGVDGKTYSLEDFSDAKVLAVIFTCNHCPDSRGAWGRIPALAKDYDPADFQIVTINSNSVDGLRPDELRFSVHSDSFEEMILLAEDKGLEVPYLYDGDTQEVALAYGPTATPFVFLFDEERKLQYTGRLDDMRHDPRPTDKSYIRDAVDALLAGEEITEKQTSGFGCGIKWSWLRSKVEQDQKAWEAREVSLESLDAELAKSLRANETDNLRLVYIWSTTCGPCIKDFPVYVDTYRRYQNRNFDFVSIAVDPPDNSEDVLKFLETHHAGLSPHTFNSLAAQGRKTNNYHFTGENPDKLVEAMDSDWKGPVPFTLLIAPGGEILWSKDGSESIDPLAMRRAIVEFYDRRWQD